MQREFYIFTIITDDTYQNPTLIMTLTFLTLLSHTSFIFTIFTYVARQVKGAQAREISGPCASTCPWCRRTAGGHLASSLRTCVHGRPATVPIAAGRTSGTGSRRPYWQDRHQEAAQVTRRRRVSPVPLAIRSITKASLLPENAHEAGFWLDR